MTDRNPDALHDEYADPPVSVSHLAHVLHRYSGAILVTLASVVLLYLIVGLAALLLSSKQKVVSLPFRLEFAGGSSGQYPNGLKFSAADITATPVLVEVFNADQLAQFMGFGRFSRSVYVVESNRALEELSREYEGKLADPKLTPIDRDRIEREFDAKRAGLNKSDYAIEFLISSEDGDIPATVVRKALSDILSTWARRAAIEKKALDYQIAIVGPSILDNIKINGNDYLIPLLLLRQRVDTVISNAAAVAEIPGARLVRTRGTRTSIAEVQLRLGEIVRFRLEPLIATARAAGLFGSNAAEILKAQLAYDQRMLTAAQMRQTALQNTLLSYQEQPSAPAATTPGQTSATRPERGAGETVMPQISDTFLDRIVDLTNRNGDREYRQKLTDQIKDASLAVVPIEASVKYDQELVDSFRSGAPAGGGTPADLKSQWDAAVAEVREVITDLNQIYNLASKQLYPETEMYRVTGPPTTRVERTLSPMRLALYGLLVFLIALPITIIIVLIHNRIREEEAAEAEQHAGHGAAASA